MVLMVSRVHAGPSVQPVLAGPEVSMAQMVAQVFKVLLVPEDFRDNRADKALRVRQVLRVYEVYEACRGAPELLVLGAPRVQLARVASEDLPGRRVLKDCEVSAVFKVPQEVRVLRVLGAPPV